MQRFREGLDNFEAANADESTTEDVQPETTVRTR